MMEGSNVLEPNKNSDILINDLKDFDTVVIIGILSDISFSIQSNSILVFNFSLKHWSGIFFVWYTNSSSSFIQFIWCSFNRIYSMS